ncbi:hypothetical protein PHMEG_000177 [Phytophthora megakarya]|uniref:Polyprotein n=1 Tax=Phytophthora megakarya TaxID=4795 RepID=A0A225X638_9STRA|nr:hypothetical protein PHMEG_000177 [Phytophthora megakarya]
MLTRLNAQRAEHLQQATELVAFEIAFEENMVEQDNSPGQEGRGNADGWKIRRSRTSWSFDKKDCPGKDDSAKELKISLAGGTGTSEDKHRSILDCGSSVNLVKNTNLLKNVKNGDEQYLVANGESIRVIKKMKLKLPWTDME